MNCDADDCAILNAHKTIMYLPTAYNNFHLILFGRYIFCFSHIFRWSITKRGPKKGCRGSLRDPLGSPDFFQNFPEFSQNFLNIVRSATLFYGPIGPRKFLRGLIRVVKGP